MTEQTENLVLELLRAMRLDLAQMKDDIRDIKLRLTALESHVANLLSNVLRQNARIDVLDERMGRIERRLESIF
jgi:predicted  nucleic acid-binding Zn-ribbon protein